jgi:hypothetical protein
VCFGVNREVCTLLRTPQRLIISLHKSAIPKIRCTNKTSIFIVNTLRLAYHIYSKLAETSSSKVRWSDTFHLSAVDLWSYFTYPLEEV